MGSVADPMLLHSVMATDPPSHMQAPDEGLQQRPWTLFHHKGSTAGSPLTQDRLMNTAWLTQKLLHMALGVGHRGAGDDKCG